MRRMRLLIRLLTVGLTLILLVGCGFIQPDPLTKANEIYKDEPREAIKLYESVIDEDETNLDAYKGLFKVLEREEKYDDLAEWLIEVLDKIDDFEDIEKTFDLVDKYCDDITFTELSYSETEELAWAADGALFEHQDDIDMDDYDNLVYLVEQYVIEKSEPVEEYEYESDEVVEEEVLKIVVPDMIGLTLDEAILICNALGIEYHLDLEPTDEYPVDTVVGQSIEPGTVVTIEDGITITTAMAPPESETSNAYPLTYVGAIYSDDYSVNLDVHMVIESIADEAPTGYYYYDHIGTAISFYGYYDSTTDGYKFVEMLDGEVTGIFQLGEIDGDIIAGHWYTPDLSKKFNVYLEVE